MFTSTFAPLSVSTNGEAWETCPQQAERCDLAHNAMCQESHQSSFVKIVTNVTALQLVCFCFVLRALYFAVRRHFYKCENPASYRVSKDKTVQRSRRVGSEANKNKTAILVGPVKPTSMTEEPSRPASASGRGPSYGKLPLAKRSYPGSHPNLARLAAEKDSEKKVECVYGKAYGLLMEPGKAMTPTQTFIESQEESCDEVSSEEPMETTSNMTEEQELPNFADEELTCGEDSEGPIPEDTTQVANGEPSDVEEEVAQVETPKRACNQDLYKTELCRFWRYTGFCRYDNKCQFAHGEAELRKVNRDPKYKTKQCNKFAKWGVCPYGERCQFAHGPMEGPATPPPSTPVSYEQQAVTSPHGSSPQWCPVVPTIAAGAVNLTQTANMAAAPMTAAPMTPCADPAILAAGPVTNLTQTANIACADPNMTPGGVNMTPGAVNMTPGGVNMTPGGVNLTQNANIPNIACQVPTMAAGAVNLTQTAHMFNLACPVNVANQAITTLPGMAVYDANWAHALAMQNMMIVNA